MVNICVVTKTWRSGAAWVAQMLVQAMLDRKARVIFIAPLSEPVSREPHHVGLIRKILPRELVGSHGRFARFNMSLRRAISSLACTILARFRTKVFLFSIPEPFFFSLPLFCLLRISGAKVMYVAHDSQPHAWGRIRLLVPLERLSYQLVYRIASELIALTPSVKDALMRDFNVPSRKITIIPHGAFILGDMVPISGQRKLLIFGSLRRNKNVLKVIQGVLIARAQGMDIRLVLAGEPLKQEDRYWDECLNTMSRDSAGFEPIVGFFPDAQMPALISQIDAFILAYEDFDSQSGVAILAGLAQRPIIGTAAGGLGELFANGLTGVTICEPVSPEEIYSAIVTFYQTDIQIWRARCAASFSRMSQELNWDDIAAKYLAVAAEP